MLRDKIIVCSILFLSIIALTGLLYLDQKREQHNHQMIQPVPSGIYGIYNAYEEPSSQSASTNFRPREYLKIIRIPSE